MKFAHTFVETLSSENFPAEWQAAAIQYRQLKRCIKRLSRELAELGLDADTLRALVSESQAQAQHRGHSSHGGAKLQYMFTGEPARPAHAPEREIRN